MPAALGSHASSVNQELEVDNTLTKPRKSTLALSAIVSAVLISGAIVSPAFSTDAENTATPSAVFDVNQGFADLVEQVQPSVVTIEVSKTMQPQASGFGGDPRAQEFFERFFGEMPAPQQPQQAQGLGSGFVVDASGYIVTNNHVIDGADQVTVRLHDGRELEAEVLGVDDKTDLALLQISAEGLEALDIGDSDSMRVGDWVVAIGNPFGLGGTATAGIISARGRDIRSGPYDDYLQIDAPINSGNSGGPVFNSAGEVVGVNTAIFSPNGGSVGIGFAIPSNQMQEIIAELKSDGAIDRGWLGIQLQDISDELASGLGLDSTEGSLIADVVAGSPAERGELRTGDVIVSYDDEAITGARELSRMVGSSDSGDEVTLGVIRNNERLELDVILGEAATQTAAVAGDAKLGELGLALAPLTDELRERAGIDADTNGMLVVRVDRGSVAAERGIQRGDVLVRADRRDVESADDIRAALGEAKQRGAESVAVLVKRGEGQQFIALPVA